MQTFLSLIALFTTALWLMLFILAARFIYLWAYANLRMGVVPSAGRAAPAVGNTQRFRQSSASRKLARQKGKRRQHNVRSKRGGPEPYRDVDDCDAEIGSRLGGIRDSTMASAHKSVLSVLDSGLDMTASF